MTKRAACLEQLQRLRGRGGRLRQGGLPDASQGAALEHELSAHVALAWADAEKEKAKRTIYNAALENCEVFATIRRCGRCAGDCHSALTQRLVDLPTVAPAPFRRGFK